MVSVNRSLTTSIFAVLTLLHPSAATSKQNVPEDEPASASPIRANISEVILVSFEGPWKEPHSTFARLLGRPVTTWSMRNFEFGFYLGEAVYQGKKPMLFATDPSVLRDAPSMLDIQGVILLICSPRLFFQQHYRITACSKGLKTPPSGCIVAEYLTMNETAIQSISWPLESSTDGNRSSNHALKKVGPFEHSCVEDIDRREITVPCYVQRYNSGNKKNCGRFRNMGIIEWLKQKNVTFRQEEYIGGKYFVAALITHNFRMTHEPVILYSVHTSMYDVPYVRVAYDAFYSRVDAHRVVSLHEVVGECWRLVTTTFALLALVVFVSVVTRRLDGSVWRGINDTALFLLAAVLATSAALPTAFGRMGLIRRALLGLWIAALLPLSAYFRTELTAMLTLRRPADRIDTLQKLEDALDRRQVAPCVTESFSHNFRQLVVQSRLVERPLMIKLEHAYLQHSEDDIVKDDISSCIECASRRDRVCYTSLEDSPSQTLRNVGPFAEHLNTWLEGFLMRKYHPLLKPLRRFFRYIEEHRLIVWDVRKSENKAEEPEFDMSGLLLLLVILHAASCLVLLLEVAVARFYRQAV